MWPGCQGGGVPNPLLHPADWFLCVWLLWRMFNPMLVWMATPWMLIVVQLISLVAGYWTMKDHTVFQVHNLFAYMPFLAIGYALPRELIAMLDNRRAKFIGLAVAVATLIPFWVGAYYSEEEPVELSCGGDHGNFTAYKLYFHGFHYMRSGYDAALSSKYSCFLPHLRTAWVLRLGYDLIAIVIGFAVLAMVPHGTYRFSTWGSNTLYAYILQHDLFHFVKAASKSWFGGAKLPAPDSGGLGIVIMWFIVWTVVGVGFNILLCCEYSRKFFKPFIEPYWILGLKKPPELPTMCFKNADDSDSSSLGSDIELTPEARTLLKDS
jgi:fucose 4-O-acetylase-like acetyltransferase